MTNSEPNSLFRFYSNINYILDCIEENRLTIPRVDLLNDPFDPNLFIHADSSWQSTIQNFKESEKTMRDEALKSIFIGSFSAPAEDIDPQKNLYMWGHYADGHRGAAVEFDFMKLEKPLPIREFESEQFQAQLKKIEYSDPKLLNNEDLKVFLRPDGRHVLDENLEENLYIKTPHWASENEYRFIDRDKETLRNIKKYDLEEETICSIYCGLKMNDNDTDRIVKAAKKYQRNVQVYKASKVTGRLDIEFKQLS